MLFLNFLTKTSYKGGSMGRVQGVRPPPPPRWFMGVEVEPETSAPPPKKNSGAAPELAAQRKLYAFSFISDTFRLLHRLLQGMNTTDKEQHL